VSASSINQMPRTLEIAIREAVERRDVSVLVTSIANAMAQAIGAQKAFLGPHVVSLSGSRGFTMLMAGSYASRS
jgi:hypothetical protein